MRLIDADKAYEVLTGYYNHKLDVQHIALIDALSKVPSVEAEPVRYGFWFYNPYGHYECSICHEELFHDDGWVKCIRTRYCPHCGAKMYMRYSDWFNRFKRDKE